MTTSASAASFGSKQSMSSYNGGTRLTPAPLTRMVEAGVEFAWLLKE